MPGRSRTAPILNTFFGWGVLPRAGGDARMLLRRRLAAPAGFRWSASTSFSAGEKRQIMVRPGGEADAWRIADITYGSGPGLVAYLRRITGAWRRGMIGAPRLHSRSVPPI